MSIAEARKDGSPPRLLIYGADVTGVGTARPEPVGPMNAARDDMIAEIRARIGEGWVLDAFREVDRADFVPEGFKDAAYANGGIPLTVDGSAVMSYYTTVATTTDLLGLREGGVALEIGAGSGFGAAILSERASEVHTVEIRPQLAAMAEGNLRRLGFDKVTVHVGDGAEGLPGAGPFDAILVTAGVLEIPQALIDQLADGGRMVIPVGDPDEGQTLTLITRVGGEIRVDPLNTVFFRPLDRPAEVPAGK